MSGDMGSNAETLATMRAALDQHVAGAQPVTALIAAWRGRHPR